MSPFYSYSLSLVTHLKLASSFSVYTVEQDRGYKNTSTGSIEPESGDGCKNRTFCLWPCGGGGLCVGSCPVVCLVRVVVPCFHCQETLGSGPSFSKLARLRGHARKVASRTHSGWAGALWMQAKWSRGWKPGPAWRVACSLLSSDGLTEARAPLLAGTAIRDDPLRVSLWTQLAINCMRMELPGHSDTHCAMHSPAEELPW